MLNKLVMKKFLAFLLFYNVLLNNAQINGVSQYTSSLINYGVGNNGKFNSTINSLGEVFYFQFQTVSPNYPVLCKYSSGVVTTYTSSVISTLFNPRLFSIGTDVWIIMCDQISFNSKIYKFDGTSFTDYTSLIFTATGITSFNCISKQNSDILIGTNSGIIKLNGTTVSVLNTGNSTLINNTVNDIKSLNYINVLVGTQNGLTTYNGTTFSAPIYFPSTSNYKVNQIYMSSTRTIVTSQAPGTNNFYNLNGTTLTLLSFNNNPSQYLSSAFNNIVVDGNEFYISMSNKNYISKVNAQILNTYYLPLSSSIHSNIFKSPISNKLIKLSINNFNPNPLVITEIDLSTYACIYTYDDNLHKSYIDTNFVKAPVFTSNTKFNEMLTSGAPSYIVPFISGVTTPSNGVSSHFASALWIGGLDNLGNLHMAAQTYKQTGTDFWPGYLDTISANTTVSNASPYNKVLKFSCNQINSFAAYLNAGNASALTSNSFSSIVNYMPNGNSVNNFAKQLAPYKDWNNNGKYEPSMGDYPLIKGHQQLLTVYNDGFGPHTESKGLALGIDVNDNLYAFNDPTLPDSMQVINFTTFNNFKITNRSNNNYNNVLVSIWNDVDLGYYLDDYIGCDTSLNFAYVYNADSLDNIGAGVNSNNTKLPMLGLTYLNNSFCLSDGVDNDNDGLIDEPNEYFKMNRVTFYNNNIGVFMPPTTNPDSATHYYNLMNAVWKDGTNFTYGANAYNTSSTNYIKRVFPGNIETNTGWTEKTAGNNKGDRRILCTIGPFNFPAKKTIEVDFAIVFSRDTSLTFVNNNLSLLKKDIKNVRTYYNNSITCLPTVNVGITKNKNDNYSFWTYPNPSKDLIFVNASKTIVNGNYNVYNTIGQSVLQGKIYNSSSFELNITNFKTGIYFIELEVNNYKVVQKIIKD
jgi:hypothetical protein